MMPMTSTMPGSISGRSPIASTSLRSFDREDRTASTTSVPNTAQMDAEDTARIRLLHSALMPLVFSVNSST